MLGHVGISWNQVDFPKSSTFLKEDSGVPLESTAPRSVRGQRMSQHCPGGGGVLVVTSPSWYPVDTSGPFPRSTGYPLVI